MYKHAIALYHVSNLFAEPLSGLDSASSMQLAVFLKTLVSNEGIAVLMSLHQPRPEIYEMMDVVGVMSVLAVLCLRAQKR